MTPPIYVLGRKVFCTFDDDPLPFLFRGWSHIESDRTWIDGVDGEIRCMMRRPSSPCIFELDVEPFLAGGPQTLEIFLNGFNAGYFEVNAPGVLSVSLPNEFFILRVTQIVLRCRTSVVGTEVGLSETRRLGIALRSWVIK